MCPQEGVALPPAGVEVTDALKGAIDKHCPGVKMTPVERFSFYDEVRASYAVVQVLERRPYGNVVLTKGVVGPDGKDRAFSAN
jgi:L-fucose mutarotase